MPPVEVNVVDAPLHIAAPGPTLIDGEEFTVIVVVILALPQVLVTI